STDLISGGGFGFAVAPPVICACPVILLRFTAYALMVRAPLVDGIQARCHTPLPIAFRSRSESPLLNFAVIVPAVINCPQLVPTSPTLISIEPGNEAPVRNPSESDVNTGINWVATQSPAARPLAPRLALALGCVPGISSKSTFRGALPGMLMASVP